MFIVTLKNLSIKYFFKYDMRFNSKMECLSTKLDTLPFLLSSILKLVATRWRWTDKDRGIDEYVYEHIIDPIIAIVNTLYIHGFFH